nr:DUF1064 domain-containing protein [Luteimonas saliphila]
MPPGMRAAFESSMKLLNDVASIKLEHVADFTPQVLGVDLAGDVETTVKGVHRGDTFTITEVEERRRSKYGAIVTYVDGIRFDSKREANYYSALKLRVAAGEVLYFLRQVPIHLPGGTKLVVDFLIAEADGRIRYVDVKGRQTPVFRLKKREVEHHYPIEIELA